jgi:hypothetical protein
VAEEFDGGGEAFLRHAVGSAIGGKEAVGREDMDMRMEDQVIAEGVDGGDGSNATVGKIKTSAEGILEGGCGSVEEVGEEFPSFAENAAQNSGNREDKLAVRHVMADACGDSAAGTADATLVAGGAEVAALACKGEEFFVTAVRALATCETGSEVAAAEKGLDGGYGAWASGPRYLRWHCS